MREDDLRKMLTDFRKGKMTEKALLHAIRRLPFEDMGFAKVDHHRSIRCGFPEVVFCEGKSNDEVVSIIRSITKAGHNALATRASAGQFAAVRSAFPDARYNERSRTMTVVKRPPKKLPGKVIIFSAGTSDIPVAEEARITAEMMGVNVQPVYDVGVAGIHRLLSFHGPMLEATAIVVVAGMEGALASVVGGLVSCPVVAVPTSVGYGASFHGLAPLLTMLNSCAAGVSVVNIDNGFGGGYVAALICAVAAKGARND
jgi:hypothetical protein